MRGVLEAVGVRANGRVWIRRGASSRWLLLAAALLSLALGLAVQGAGGSRLCHEPGRAAHARAPGPRRWRPFRPRSAARCPRPWGPTTRATTSRPPPRRSRRADARPAPERQLRGGRGHGCLRRAAPVPRPAGRRLRRGADAGGAGGAARAGQPRRVLAPGSQRVVPQRPARARAGLHDPARPRRPAGRTADARAEPLEQRAGQARARPQGLHRRRSRRGLDRLHRPDAPWTPAGGCFRAACRSAADSC